MAPIRLPTDLNPHHELPCGSPALALPSKCLAGSNKSGGAATATNGARVRSGAHSAAITQRLREESYLKMRMFVLAMAILAGVITPVAQAAAGTTTCVTERRGDRVYTTCR
jgi:hypothetical protein